MQISFSKYLKDIFALLIWKINYITKNTIHYKIKIKNITKILHLPKFYNIFVKMLKIKKIFDNIKIYYRYKINYTNKDKRGKALKAIDFKSFLSFRKDW